MQTIAVQDARRVDTPHKVDVRPLHDTEHTQVTIITLEPGEALRLHATPVDAFFYILTGEAVVEIGEERQVVPADTLVHSPARVPHRLRNEGTATCRFLVVKTPRPDRPGQML